MRCLLGGFLLVIAAGSLADVAADALKPTRQLAGTKIMTLNMAHGRAAGFSQLFQSTHRVKQNLDDIAALLNREKPAIVALQEIDSHSFWNGWFNHGEYLSNMTDLSYHFVGHHAANTLFNYGTGLMSQAPLSRQQSVVFNATFLRPRKGFVLSTVSWPASPSVQVDVVSVHLDFLSSSVRVRQLERLIDTLQGRHKPLIVMGDFNSELNDGSGLLPHLMAKLGLHTWQPWNQTLSTFSARDRRLDYILVSGEFEFRNHKILDDSISDHKAVLAELVLRDIFPDPRPTRDISGNDRVPAQAVSQ